jgi:glycosyltransferase involved in cell wall biosynthesis
MFDYIFITHLPAFYKINLYNELSKKLKICVIFVGNSSSIRTADFVAGHIDFEYYFLSDKEFEKRNTISCLVKLMSILRKLKFKKIVVGGWDLAEFWLAVFLTQKNKNALALESSDRESTQVGIKSILKKLFLSRISTVFASGAAQTSLLTKLGYTQKTYVTKGVGIINKPEYTKNEHIFSKKFLYIGRLSPEKNLFSLIETFNKLPDYALTIVGSGNLDDSLKEIASSNIKFIQHVKNEEIHKIYVDNDVFILPSLSEPWGLVIEEAFYFGLPVILSDQVGCGPELVQDGVNGKVFDVQSKEGLMDAITEISQDYTAYVNAVHKIDLEKKDQEQIASYINALKN